MQKLAEPGASTAQDRQIEQFSPSEIDLVDIFRLPREFPHERYQMLQYISGQDGVLCFQAHDTVREKNVFVKFLTRPIEFGGTFQDFKFSFGSSDPAIVPSVALFDTVQHFLQHDERGPRHSNDEILSLQLLGFDEYMERFATDPANANVQFRGFWTAIVKEYVPGAVPLHEFTRENGHDKSWLRPKVMDLVELLASKGLVVRDLLIRPDGSLSGNILVIPEEKRVCISDLEYSDVLPENEARKVYQLLLPDFDHIINGDRLRNVGKLGRPFLVWDTPDLGRLYNN